MVEREALFEERLIAPRGRGRLASSEHAGAAGGAACGDLIPSGWRSGSRRAHVAEAGFSAAGAPRRRRPAARWSSWWRGPRCSPWPGLPPRTSRARSAASRRRDGTRPTWRRTLYIARSERRSATGAPPIAVQPTRPRRDERRRGQRGRGTARRRRRPRGRGCDARAVVGPGDGRDEELLLTSGGHGRACARAPHGHPSPHPGPAGAIQGPGCPDFLAEHAAGRTPNPCVPCNGQVLRRHAAGRFPSWCREARDRSLRAHRAGRRGTPAARRGRLAQGPDIHACAPPARTTWPGCGSRSASSRSRWSVSSRAMPSCPWRTGAKPGPLLPGRHPAGPVPDPPRRPGWWSGGGSARAARADRGRGGRVLGAHAEQDRFTVGQRRGIGIASSEPLYVLRKEPERNLVVVGPRSARDLARRGHLRPPPSSRRGGGQRPASLPLGPGSLSCGAAGAGRRA